MAVRAVALLVLAVGVACNAQHRQQLALKTDSRASLAQIKAPTGAHHLAQPIELESVTEKRSYGDRVQDAWKGCVIGFVLFFSSFVFLFFVEMETCKAFVLINRARKACRTEISVDKVQKKFEKPVGGKQDQG